jgi:hypothetical protein
MSNGVACHLVGGTEQLQLSASSQYYTTKLPGGAVSVVLFRGQIALLAAHRTQDGPKSGLARDAGRAIDGRKKRIHSPTLISRGAQYQLSGDTVSPVTVAASSRLRSTPCGLGKRRSHCCRPAGSPFPLPCATEILAIKRGERPAGPGSHRRAGGAYRTSVLEAGEAQMNTFIEPVLRACRRS